MNPEIAKLFSEQVSDEERKRFLLDLNARGITARDIADFVEFLLPTNFPHLEGAIDICGTGGSGLSRINTSTISAFLLASAGVGVAKHGNRAASGRFGSFDLLEKLGVNIDLSATQIAEVYAQENLAFIFAQKFFPAMRFFAGVRRELGVPTVFNLLGPLLNPAQPERQIIGTSSRQNARLIAEAASLIGRKQVVALTGEDGLDDITLTGKTYCVSMRDGELTEFEIAPEDFGFERASPEDIVGGDANDNTEIALDILTGECETAHYDLVLCNAAFALFFAGMTRDLKEAVSMAEDQVDSGSALVKLDNVRNFAS